MDEILLGFGCHNRIIGNKMSIHKKAIGSVLTIYFLTIVCQSALAKTDIRTSWLKEEMSLDNSDQIYLNTTFHAKRGKFHATHESIIDEQQSVVGQFMVAAASFV